MDVKLPEALARGAVLRDREYAWEFAAFPVALANASQLGYACLGGQFWFLLPDNSVCELFWLEANSVDRSAGESWLEYARRSCGEVLSQFVRLSKETDFIEEAKKFRTLESVPKEDFGSQIRMLFNAYFVTEQEYSQLQRM